MSCYTVTELAEELKVHPETIKREVNRNKLRHFKVGTELRFKQEHVDEYTNVLRYGKTTKEIELEKEIEELKLLIDEKDNFINVVRTELLKMNSK